MAINYAALKQELQNDPQALGYALILATGNHVAIAALMNDPTKGGTLNLPSADCDQVRAQIVASEYATMSANDKAFLNFLLAGRDLYLSNNVKSWVNALPNFTLSKSGAGALFSRPQSRAEALFGQNTIIQYGDIAIALG